MDHPGLCRGSHPHHCGRLCLHILHTRPRRRSQTTQGEKTVFFSQWKKWRYENVSIFYMLRIKIDYWFLSFQFACIWLFM